MNAWIELVGLNLKLMLAKWRVLQVMVLGVGLLGYLAVLASGHFVTRTLQPVVIGVINGDLASVETTLLLNGLKETSEEADIQFVMTTQDEATVDMENGELTAIVTIPQGFGQAMITGENTPFELMTNASQPLSSALIRLVVDALTDTLKTSQMGVYTTLDFAREQGVSEAVFDDIFMRINLMFINLVMDRGGQIQTVELPLMGGLSVADSYLLTFYVLGLTMLAAIYAGVFSKALSTYQVVKLAQIKQMNSLSIASSVIMAYVALTSGGVLLLFVYFGRVALLGGLAVGAVISGYMGFCSLFFSKERTQGGFIIATTLVMLLFSGGLVPSMFLPRGINQLAVLTYPYWFIRYMASGQMQSLGVLMGIFAGFVALTTWAVERRKGR